MPAAVHQQARLPRRDHRRAEIDALDRAARSLAQPAIHADDEGRPAVAFDEAARDDADHPDMPTFALDHERRRQSLAVGTVEALDARDRLVQHLALDGAALGIELVQPQRQRADLFRIVAGQQPCAEIGLSDAASGIDARAQHEAKMIGARRLAQARHVGQRGQADVASVGHHPQALAHQRPVDAGQWHDIAHSPQGDEVEPLAQVRLGARASRTSPPHAGRD